jgi:membrane-bound lytic murein transglycosylase A
MFKRLLRRAGAIIAAVLLVTEINVASEGSELHKGSIVSISHDITTYDFFDLRVLREKTQIFSAIPPDVDIIPKRFTELKNWEHDDHILAWNVFLHSCKALVEQTPSLRQGKSPSAGLVQVCQQALKRVSLKNSAPLTRLEAKAFFEEYFLPFEIRPQSGNGFLTGYYEPVVEGSWSRSKDFNWPLLARPSDLITLPAGQKFADIPEGYASARQTPKGGYEIYPDRAAIEQGVLGNLARPLLYVRDEAEAFSIQIQGSARIHLRDDPQGRSHVRVAYAGRNGHPYTSVGRRAVEKGYLTREMASMDNLMQWLREHPFEGSELIRENRSFVFFRIADELDDARGPLGAASVQLTPDRSLAVDRTLWAYGTPIWLQTDLSDLAIPTAGIVQRLMIAQDTGSAITGAARADYYVGSGEHARLLASRMRHSSVFTVLVPKADLPLTELPNKKKSPIKK